MKTIGFLISHKNNERRRALLPKDLVNINYKKQLFFEKGYGECLGINDQEYVDAGANICTREEAFKKDIICDVKLGDADYLDKLDSGKTLFGWAHAVQNIDFTTKCIEKKHTVIAWEEMYEDGRYIFYLNRELAGEAGVLQALTYCGMMPYDAKIAIIGNGKTAKGAMRVLTGLGGKVDVYDYNLEDLFRKKMYDYDIIVNCVMWDTSRTDRLIYKENLKKFRRGTIIIDISCDPHLEIETTHPTTISNPIYEVDGIIHYAVDNTPAMMFKTTTKHLSNVLCLYLDDIINSKPNNTIDKACVIDRGKIIDERITNFRKQYGIYNA